MSKNIIGYGELLLRLTPEGRGGLIEQAHGFKTGFAGAEANILSDMALLGHSTTFLTAFPDNPVGRAANLFLQRFGVDTRPVVWNEHRLATYFIEHGTSIRGTRVTYDRKYSAVSLTRITEKQWETVFQQADYFILTGITPALSQICRDNISDALRIARDNQVKIVFDLNFRRSLWTAAEARPVYTSIMPYVDILFANIGSAYDIFGIQTGAVTDFDSLKKASIEAVSGLEEFGEFDFTGMTLRRQESAHHNLLGGLLKKEGRYYFSEPVPTEIVDRLGGGDAFAAAVLHGLIKKWTPEAIISFATAAFAATQTIEGDINYLTEAELQAIASGSIRGFVKR